MPLYLSFLALTLTYDYLLVTLCVSYLSRPPFLRNWSSWWGVYAYFAHCCYSVTLHTRLAHSRNPTNIYGRKEWRRKEESKGIKKAEVGERREGRGSCKAVMGGRAMCNTQSHHWELMCGGNLKEDTNFLSPLARMPRPGSPFKPSTHLIYNVSNCCLESSTHEKTQKLIEPVIFQRNDIYRMTLRSGLLPASDREGLWRWCSPLAGWHWWGRLWKKGIGASKELEGFPGGTNGKESACQRRRRKRHQFDSWVGKIPWRRIRYPTPVFLPGESHRQRNLASHGPYSPKSRTWLKQLKVKVKLLSHVRLFATPWTAAYQVPPSMGFSRQEYWSGLPLPSPGDLPNPGIEPRCPAL